MYNKLKALLKKNPRLFCCLKGIKNAGHKLVQYIQYIEMLMRLYSEKKKVGRDDVIRVVFIIQYVPSWNKYQLLYEKMRDDKRFQVFLVCVPFHIKNHELYEEENEVYNYYKQLGYDAINARLENGEWFDIQALKPHYVFHSRPYNHFMPVQYTSQVMCRYTKICNIMYGMNISHSDLEFILDRDYFNAVFCYFAETEEIETYYKKKYALGHKLHLQKSVCFGIPVFEYNESHRADKTVIWDFAGDRMKVMWIPRWSTALKMGGSNFFFYREGLLKYAAKCDDMALLIRPHPLMFENFVSTGEMSLEEVNAFKDACANSKNIQLDTEKEYVATLWNTDVLIADYSSMIPEFFVMGKPLIYCTSSMEYKWLQHMEMVMSGCYIANNWQELENYLEMLRRGDDPLKNKRKQIVNEVFGKHMYTSVSCILEYLVQN